MITEASTLSDSGPCLLSQNAISLLNTVLLERAPKDPPPPRRSKRAPVESPSPTPAPKGKERSQEFEADNSRPSNFETTVSFSQEEETDSPDATSQSKRKRVVRNVGGWISPEFANEVDRSWLSGNSASSFDVSTYVPQVGDSVL